MFENEIKFISDFTLNKVKELGSFITVEKFLSIDIHPAIKKYVEGEIDYLISEDRKKLIENSLFDYSGTEISNYFTLIGNEIKKTKKISFEDIKNIVLQAVSFNANYVVRPKWSLSKLIFGNNKSVSVNELRLMLNYTYYYEYLNNVFLAYLSKKKILNITVTEFELIVNKIDRELFMLHQSKLVDNALYAIADYFSIGGLNKSTVTVDSVENFLKEKNLTELLFKLKRTYANSAKKKVDIDDVRKVLYSTLSIDSPFVEEDNQEIVAANEKHFENPLKEDFVTEEPISENEELHEKENVFDLGKQDETEAFVNEEQAVEMPYSDLKANIDEKLEEDLEEAITISEPEKFEIKNEDDQILENILDKREELGVSELKINDDIAEIDLSVNDHNSVEESESLLKESIDEEDVLASLTEEIEKEKDKDDEIVILDEKEQEDLLNFYDNELEISIDDDMPLTKTINTETDENSSAEINELEFEHEPLINADAEIALEKIDFEKDLAAVDPELQKKESETVLKSNIKTKASDIFTYLSNKEIDKIIKNLFNSDSEDFANTVEKMSDCSTYEEATHILENVFKYARIKPHSREAASLSNAVSKYFNVEK
ncbi:MAG: hypothetical protein IPI19_05755 [Ignavibacteriales bacterium]|nr:hypothetical protein [Ignavibacteriales bacterium]MBP9120160.1 hypothetical protein [Ignavibacterium sp.]